MFGAVVTPDQLEKVREALPVSSMVGKADGVHVRFVGESPALPEARAVEPTLEDAYLLTRLQTADEEDTP